MYSTTVLQTGIIGASGYTGAELLRLCAGHPDLEVVVATGDTQAGVRVCDLYPSLGGAYPELTFTPYEPSVIEGLDLAFLALPHGASQALVGDLIDRVGAVVDLAADFRLGDASLYPRWYGEAHSAPELLGRFSYGLPELFRADIIGSQSVAAPGCYPTTAALALAPLVGENLVDTQMLIVDAASGVSGAGRPPKPNTTFCTADEDFTAYGLLKHRHTPEMEQSVARVGGLDTSDVSILFTPHLAPMSRGILATCYARPKVETSSGELLELFRETYANEPFIVVMEGSPSTKATFGSNAAHLTVRADERTGWIVAIAALDNLVKGASGQAIQCANIISGLDETAGLTSVGVYP